MVLYMINIGTVLLSRSWGGAETVVHEILKNQNDSAKKQFLFVNSEIIHYFSDLSDTVVVHDIGPLYSITGMLGLWAPKKPSRFNRYFAFFGKIPFFQLFLSKRLNNLLKKYKIDILHYHLDDALSLSYFISFKKSVFTIHGEMGLENDAALMNEKELKIKALKKLPYITSACHYFVTFLKKFGVDAQFEIVPNGISLLPNKISSKKVSDKTNFFFAGGARYLKGGDILVNALVNLPKKYHLYILRDVPDNHIMKRVILENNLSSYVTFLGFQNRDDYLSYLKSCDALLLPSRQEGIAASIMDALALGKPVIATDVGGTSEIITTKKNGLLSRPNSNDYCNVLSAFLDGSFDSQNASKLNLEIADKLSWNNVIVKYNHFYERIQNEKN